MQQITDNFSSIRMMVQIFLPYICKNNDSLAVQISVISDWPVFIQFSIFNKPPQRQPTVELYTYVLVTIFFSEITVKYHQTRLFKLLNEYIHVS